MTAFFITFSHSSQPRMLYEPLFYQQNGGTCGPVCQTLILMIRATGRSMMKHLSWGRVCLNWWIGYSFTMLHKYKNYVYHFFMPVSSFRPYLWVYYAVKLNVQELDLSLPVRATFLLHSSLFTTKSLSKLQLYMDCILKVPSSICFSALKMLHISVTFLDDQSCQQLFSGCPVLQE